MKTTAEQFAVAQFWAVSPGYSATEYTWLTVEERTEQNGTHGSQFSAAGNTFSTVRPCFCCSLRYSASKVLSRKLRVEELEEEGRGSAAEQHAGTQGPSNGECATNIRTCVLV